MTDSSEQRGLGARATQAASERISGEIENRRAAFQNRSTMGKAWAATRTLWWLGSRGAWFAGLATLADTALSYLWFVSGAWVGAIVWFGVGLWSLRKAWRLRRPAQDAAERRAARLLGWLALAAAAMMVGWLHWTGLVDWGGWLRARIEIWTAAMG